MLINNDEYLRILSEACEFINQIIIEVGIRRLLFLQLNIAFLQLSAKQM